MLLLKLQPYIEQQLLFLLENEAGLGSMLGHAISYDWQHECLLAGSNPIVLGGDSHNAWAHEVADEQGRKIACEFDAPAISAIGASTEESSAWMACNPPPVTTLDHMSYIKSFCFAEPSSHGVMFVMGC